MIWSFWFHVIYGFIIVQERVKNGIFIYFNKYNNNNNKNTICVCVCVCGSILLNFINIAVDPWKNYWGWGWKMMINSEREDVFWSIDWWWGGGGWGWVMGGGQCGNWFLIYERWNWWWKEFELNREAVPSRKKCWFRDCLNEILKAFVAEIN